jgi:hypothetical protein
LKAAVKTPHFLSRLLHPLEPRTVPATADADATGEVIDRPGLTVITREDHRFDAQGLTLAVVDARWCLTFLCSGALTTIPVEEVASIRFDVHGPGWCMTCDQALRG